MPMGCLIPSSCLAQSIQITFAIKEDGKESPTHRFWFLRKTYSALTHAFERHLDIVAFKYY
jgi:hypothetical protein